MIDLFPLAAQLSDTPLEQWADQLQAQFDAKLAISHGDLPRWKSAVDALPKLTVESINLDDKVALNAAVSTEQSAQILSALQGLIPWRKGPFDFFDTHINTEWRSDWKWERVRQHIDLHGRRVLDVGCGNGYHMWRMLGDGAKMVVGVDPNWLFFCQYLALRKYIPDGNVWHLPFAFEELPEKLEGFDTVFSMGVLYHRKSPIDHLLALKDALRNGGELVLETLVVEGDAQQVLVPEDRYSQMRNVWFLPSVKALELWLKRAGFVDVRCVDITVTSTAEQRATEWMKYQSLPDFLDPNDASKTVEGLPAPTRAVLVARKP